MDGFIEHLYVAVLPVSAVVSAGVAVATWRRRSNDGAAALTAMLIGVEIWVLTRFLTVLASDPSTSFVLARLSYLGVFLAPASLFVFVLQFTGRGELVGRRLVALLAVEPAIVIAVSWLAPYSGLMWTSVEPADNILGFAVELGPLFWVHAVYTYLLLAAATALLFEMLYRSRHLYTQQVVALLVATLGPWLTNIAYLTGATPLNFTPVAFTLTGAALAVALFGASLMDLSPVARSMVVDHINQSVFVLDDENRLTDVNEGGAEMLGFDESAIGRRLSAVLSEHPEFIETLEEVSEGHREVVVDTDRGRRTYSVEVTPLVDYRDRVQGRLIVVRDVTRQRHRERELERQNERLEEFAGVVSHDLRSPLSVIQGYTDLARETGDLDHLDEVDDAVDRTLQLVDDLLELAHEGQAIDATEPVSLEATARAAWHSVDAPAALMIVSEDVSVLADPSRLQQALENLFRNSVEHGGDVTITVGATTDGFYVADDGPGIPEDERAGVFDHGYTTDPDGTGFGLSIVEAIAEAHGWTVEIAEDAAGARFEFASVERPSSRTARP